MPETIIKKLPVPWNVGGVTATEIELRPSTVEDLMEAEKEGHPGLSPTTFNVALACRQMLRAGSFTGPFTIGQFRSMKPAAWYVIRDALQEADQLGEPLPAGPVQPS